MEEKQNEEKPEKVIGELPIVYKDNFNDEIIKEMIRFLQRIFGLEGIGVNYNYGKNSNRDSSNDLFKLLNNKRFRNFENNSGYKTKSESIKDFEYIKSLLTEADLPIMVSSDLEIIRELIITSITFMKRINKNDKKNKAFWKNIFKKLLEWYLECYYNYYPKALNDVFYYTKSWLVAVLTSYIFLYMIWAPPISLATTFGIVIYFLFLRVIRCFSSPGSPTRNYGFITVYCNITCNEFPHSDIYGSRFICNSP